MTHSCLDLLRSLGLPVGHHVLFGSGPLLARGWIDEVGDLDVLARGPAWERARQLGDEVHLDEWNVTIIEIDEVITIGTRWAVGEVDVDDLIDRAEMIDGIPCAPLRDVITYKRILARPKDLAHLDIIAARLDPGM